MEKNLYIIAGCNGAGKTTACFTILPEIIECKEYVNADEIAKGLSPFQPEKVAFESGRIMPNGINELINSNENFAFETTLATKIYKSKIETEKALGYNISLLYFLLSNVELAKERVKIRVSEGGHNIEEEVIARRYQRRIDNLFNIYLPIVDDALIFDNSVGNYALIAEKKPTGFTVVNVTSFNQLKNHHENRREI